MVSLETLSIVFTGLSVSLAAFYYISTLRNAQRTRELTLKAQEQAVETRQAQLFMQLYNRWQDMDWAWLRPHLMTKPSSYEEFWEKLNNDLEFSKAVNDMVGFLEGLGVIVKEGYLSMRLVALMWAGVTRMFFENFIDPFVERMREETGYPRGWSETEYVCRELIKYMDEHPELKT